MRIEYGGDLFTEQCSVSENWYKRGAYWQPVSGFIKRIIWQWQSIKWQFGKSKKVKSKPDIELTVIWKEANPCLADCPAMSFVFVFVNIRNTNQLSWAIN